MINATSSGIAIDDMMGSFDAGISQVEVQMNDLIAEFESDPNSMTQQQMIVFQAILQQYSAYTMLESSVIKKYGDTISQIASNAGG